MQVDPGVWYPGSMHETVRSTSPLPGMDAPPGRRAPPYSPGDLVQTRRTQEACVVLRTWHTNDRRYLHERPRWVIEVLFRGAPLALFADLIEPLAGLLPGE